LIRTSFQVEYLWPPLDSFIEPVDSHAVEVVEVEGRPAAALPVVPIDCLLLLI
jgi:hypothetical protein